jgi:hypothetical protein
MIRHPPKKLPGQQAGRRRIAGSGGLLDVAGVAEGWFHGSEKAVYAQVARHQIPFRRFGRRLVFLRSELDRYFAALDGVTLDEALAERKRKAE